MNISVPVGTCCASMNGWKSNFLLVKIFWQWMYVTCRTSTQILRAVEF